MNYQMAKQIISRVLFFTVAASYVQAQSSEHDMHKKEAGAMHQEHQEHQGMHDGMMEKSSQQKMQMVKSKGILNKVMPEHRHVNISHEPIPELNWPKMKMNFQTDKSVDLSGLKPGQKVIFTLQVDEQQNYLIKEMMVE